jgi:hypothetical protein
MRIRQPHTGFGLKVAEQDVEEVDLDAGKRHDTESALHLDGFESAGPVFGQIATFVAGGINA